MRITRLDIRDFRNFEQVSCRPDPGLNVLIGENAQGKTNFLEAIYFVLSGSTFRSARERDLIRWGQNSLYIKAFYLRGETEKTIEVSCQPDRPKITKVNNKRRFSPHDKPAVVLFTPDDLLLLKGPPQGRRSFIDFVLKQVSSEYSVQLESLERLLKKKSAYLRSGNPLQGVLSAINKVLAETSASIIRARLNLVRILEENTDRYYRLISDTGESISLKYALSFPVEGGKLNTERIRDAMQEHLARNSELEILRGMCLYGPHRDDVNVYIDQKPARVFASQGQQRNIVVALKLAELETLHMARGNYPVFLLDEVLAEFDAKRKQHLLELIAGAPYQTFLSSVDISIFTSVSGRIIKVKEGRVI